MLWLAITLLVVSVVSFALGLVLFTNGTGVAPHRRTSDDPSGVKRAADRVAWPDVFRRMPSSLAVLMSEKSARHERIAAAGSLCVMIAVIAAVIAVLALLAAFV
ncbi:hypothetical protein MKUB_26480 [Mycobacterium kubicae]|uniref:Uncharacterized protein n=1 Tax=Mycobacterium kubicae TaxID=120959 RepID=A0AAX1JIP9_9MYCO|nr:hypothetical protein [Mycobacterium kubicae]MCV7096014.1 hypothetical protein [Mycobacterium kubicae]OBF23732.1 hypothetical protein A5725_09125 [Mycobacterium kubicae]OBK55544.1 hypothetical protein A5657_11210 [Mycobacterium kubicae]ORV99302.1 hypothetical protein AWC13_11165 [Mycobacterium kubicae]QNI12176.1 hypothetical protein GAN18_14020 [Mycobacterium kubicae]